MDSSLNAAALALAHGDVLGALNRVALRTDPSALAIHGTAMAQLGDFAQARKLLRKAAQAFGRREEIARARCVLAEAEIALVSRDLAWPDQRLEQARTTLLRRGDVGNAAHATCIAARLHLLLGQLDRATAELATLRPVDLQPSTRAAWWLTTAGIHVRRIHARAAHRALSEGLDAARASAIPPLLAEVEAAQQSLAGPAAFLTKEDTTTPATLADVEQLFASQTLVLDTLRATLRQGEKIISFASRPVLFALLHSLASGADVSRETLLRHAFGARHADESHRARLRVEITRLRPLLESFGEISATSAGYCLKTTQPIATLALPGLEQNSAVLALLSDGELWSSSALAQVLQLSLRTVQRALDELQRQARIQPIGNGRARRWTILALPGFPTTLLLPVET
nr:helix-turn-helix domain-containing protein [uncultured Devosia sp.]